MTSKLIMVVIGGGTSIINSSLTLSAALERQGYRMIYISQARYREYIEKQGFEFHTFEMPDIAKPSPETNRSGKWNNYLSTIRKRVALRDQTFSAAEQWIDIMNPCLVLLDPMYTMLAVPILRKKIPLISLNPTMASFFFQGSPPIFSSLFPANKNDLLLKIKIKIAWTRLMAVHHVMHWLGELRSRIALGAGNLKSTPALIASNGGVMKITEYGWRLVLPEIVLVPKLIDFPDLYERKKQRCYAGMCVIDHRKDHEFDFNCLDPHKPLIYCAMGTSSSAYVHAAAFCKCLFEVMQQLPGYQLVLQTDALGSCRDYKDVPKNVLIFNRVPQLQLLKVAKLFITHGGSCSIREGISAGTPMIVFPGWNDQFGNAARIKYYGLGLMGNMKTVSVQVLKNMILHVLDNERMNNAVQSMRKAISEHNEMTATIAFIEQHINGKADDNTLK